MKNRIRIESHENVVRDAKIFYVPDEGDEVDISRCITGVDLHLHVGEVSRATLHTILVDGHVTAEVEDVIVNRLKPRQRFRRLRRARRRFVSWLKSRIARSLSHEIQRELMRVERRDRRMS